MSFNNLDAIFLKKFLAFYAEKGYSESTTHKAINILVWFMNWATDNGYSHDRKYRNLYKLLTPVKKSARPYLFLSWEELMKVRDFTPDKRKLERVRDLFCFMCFTGIRFTHLQTLTKEDIGGEDIVIRKKRGALQKLPMNKYAREISQVYENKFYLNNAAFPSMSIITMNKYLRQIGQEIRLDRQVPGTSGNGSKAPLYERLTAGIAINTFIANAIELGVSADVISSFTGVRNDSRISRIKSDLEKQEIGKFDQR